MTIKSILKPACRFLLTVAFIISLFAALAPASAAQARTPGKNFSAFTGDGSLIAPSDLKATPTSATWEIEVDLSWTDNSPDETNFNVERSLDDGASWLEFAVLDANTTSWVTLGWDRCKTIDFRVRAYRSTDGVYSDYSNIASALTAGCPEPGSPPILTSPTATSVTGTTAMLGATITDDGGTPIAWAGSCWGTSPAPTTHCAERYRDGIGAFSWERNDLYPGTHFYYRGIATNAAYTGYSPDGSFYTEPKTQASNLYFPQRTSTTVTVAWYPGNGDGVIVLMRYGLPVNSGPVDGTYTTYTDSPIFGLGSQVGADTYVIYKGREYNGIQVTGLEPNANYYVAIYEFQGMVDTSGTDQGTNYKTPPLVGSIFPGFIPSVTTQEVTVIGQTIAAANGNVTNLGDPYPTQHGFVWNTTGAPTTSDNKTIGGPIYATGAFTASLTKLTPSITYHMRAYATNSSGTAYGNEVIFTTNALGKYASTTKITGDSPNPSTAYHRYTVSVTVSGSYGSPTGSVSVTDGGEGSCFISSLSSGTGSCVLISTSKGTKTLTATYSGDGNYKYSSKTKSHTVNPGVNILHGSGVIPDSTPFNFGTGLIDWSPNYLGIGYLYGENGLQFGNISDHLACQNFNTYPTYHGPDLMWNVHHAASDYAFSSPPVIQFAAVNVSCNTGILVFHQGNFYGGLEFLDVDNNQALHYNWWYDPNGGDNFSSIDPEILTVIVSGTGTGTITSKPAGIDCGDICSKDFPENTGIVLTANPAFPSTFEGWSGASCSRTGTCTVTVDSAQSIYAYFNNPLNSNFIYLPLIFSN
jgi:hypothetical protein